MIDKKKQGKKNRRKGKEFELKVRKYLESKGWIVSKWANNVEFEELPDDDGIPFNGEGKLIPAKPQYHPYFKRIIGEGSGFCDFIVYKLISGKDILEMMKNG